MLPFELLRVRISGKTNQIRPIFYNYDKDDDLILPSKIKKGEGQFKMKCPCEILAT